MESFSRLRALLPVLASLTLLPLLPLAAAAASDSSAPTGAAAPANSAPSEVPEGIILDAESPTAPEAESLEATPIEEPEAAELELEFSDPETAPDSASPASEMDEAGDRDASAEAETPSQTSVQETASPEESENAEEAIETERVFIADNQISFVPPEGFTPMSETEIQAKFPGNMPPQYAVANDRRNVSIGVSLSDIALAPEQLPEVRQFLEGFLETEVPGFEWVSRDYETLGGNRWIRLEFISQAIDTRVHNDLYITSFDGKLLGFNFNAILSLEEDLRPQLRDSRDSIVLTPIETARQ